MSEIPNPLDDFAQRYGRLNAAAVGVVVVGVVAAIFPNDSLLPWILGAGVVIMAATSDAFATTPPSEIDRTKQLFVEGEITHDEFEQRVGMLLDEQAQEIRQELARRVNGVGPETSTSVAQEFDTLDDVRLASVDDLTTIHGIGDSTANAIVDEFGEPAEQVAARNRAAADTAATDGGRP